jgi:tRNA1(Val) A37 N6-methylase TrmN6
VSRGIFNFVFAIEDQRDWQRDGRCHSNPFSCFFCHLLSIFNIKKVLDLNYGIGGFYEKCHDNLEIAGVDIRKWDWLVKPHRFIQADMIDALNRLGEGEKFDAAVMDPPYNTVPSSKIKESGRDYLYYGHVPFPKILKAIKTIKEKGIANYIILKYMPTTVDEEIELMKMAKYRIMWRFTRFSIAANDNNKVIRNYTEIFII